MSSSNRVRVFGASEHNLRSIDVDFPRQSLTVVTGLSGSGKSSLAFDTLYAEGQRRYVESLSAYARQFLDQLPKPHVDKIEGLSPAISIEQKSVSRNPRSTVGTVTEIYDYMRLLFATAGSPHCPHCGEKLVKQDAATIVSHAMGLPTGTRLLVLAPVVRGRKGEYQALFQKALRDGFVRAKIDGEVLELDPTMRLRKQYRHDVSLVVDRLIVRPGAEKRLEEAVRRALVEAERLVILETVPDRDGSFPPGLAWKGERTFSEELGCPEHGAQVVDLAPRLFSFNSPHGACPACEGIGTIPEVDESLLVPDPGLSLRRGAVLPWRWHFARPGQKNLDMMADVSRHARALKAVLEAWKVDTDTPWRDLPAEVRRVLLHGYEQSGTRKRRVPAAVKSWKGLVHHLQQRLESVRDEEEIESIQSYLRQVPCPACHGARLREESLAVTIADMNIAEISRCTIGEALDSFRQISFTGREAVIASQPLREIRDRLGFLLNVGLGYLTLDRPAATLSGGEAQRIRLATQIGSRLKGVLYVLDEPSIGLHQRDNEKLIETLRHIRDQGNTIVVVEHDEQTIRGADWVIDLGPGAGNLGGEVVGAGLPKKLERVKESLTGQYLSGRLAIPLPPARRKPTERRLVLQGCTHHNLRHVELDLPLGLMIGVTGVSGSGKSSLIMDTLLPLVMRHCYKASNQVHGPVEGAEGLEHLDRCVHVDQAPIGRTPRSNPATYTKAFDPIRDIFSKTEDARLRGYGKGRFSFNVKGGRCEHCMGQGAVRMQMDFLPDVYVTCEICNGLRYNDETLQVRYRGRNIAEVLEMTIDEAAEHFSQVPTITDKLETLRAVGLGYLHLGQPATTLSGGEAQRIKLARELSKRNTGRALYILDEPTTGLHFADVHKLIEVLNKLVDTGSTVVVIEHQLDLIKAGDWVLDMGPGAGDDGGLIVAQGTPEQVAANKKSETGRFLAPLLGVSPNGGKRRKRK